MIRTSITAAAFEAITATLRFGSGASSASLTPTASAISGLTKSFLRPVERSRPRSRDRPTSTAVVKEALTEADHTIAQGVTGRRRMEPEWLSYAQVGDRLGITPEAARSRAKRLRWRRQTANDGKTLVLVALEPRPPGDLPVTSRPSLVGKAIVVSALESHIKTLLGENEALKEQLSASGARLAAAEGRAEQEAEKTGKAIAAFSDLARRLNALAEERARPWWLWLRIAGGREARVGRVA